MHGQPPFLPSCTHPNQPLSGPMKRSFPFPLSTVFEHSCCTQLLQTTLWNLHTITPKLLENGGNHLIYSYIKQSSYRESCLKAKHNSTSHSQKTKATSGLFLLSCYVSLYLQHCNLIATSQSGDGTTGPQPQPTKSKVFCLISSFLPSPHGSTAKGHVKLKAVNNRRSQHIIQVLLLIYSQPYRNKVWVQLCTHVALWLLLQKRFSFYMHGMLYEAKIWCLLSLVPRPRPAFRRLQCGKRIFI